MPIYALPIVSGPTVTRFLLLVGIGDMTDPKEHIHEVHSRRSTGRTAALLYTCSLALQLPCAWVRTVLALPVIWVLLFALGLSTTLAQTIALTVGFGPLVISLATLAIPAGGSWWQLRAGVRAPTTRERHTYLTALDALRWADPTIRTPRQWFVLDDIRPHATAYADTLLLTRGLLDSPWLTAVLAHELGHFNSLDARMIAAIDRLTTPPRQPLARPWLRAIAAIATGQLPARLMTIPWTSFWHDRDYAADAYAARLGQAAALTDYLHINATTDNPAIPSPSFSPHTHPPAEDRIERLHLIAETTGQR